MGSSVLLFFFTCLHILEAIETTGEGKPNVETQNTKVIDQSTIDLTTITSPSRLNTTVHLQTEASTKTTEASTKTTESSTKTTEPSDVMDIDGGNGHSDHAQGGRGRRRMNATDQDECTKSENACRDIVMKCGPSLLRDMSKGGDIEDHEDKPPKDPCRCLFHCFDHFGHACRSLTRKLNRLQDDKEESHGIFNHLGPLVGIFVAGVVVGILIALLIANTVKQCVDTRRTRVPSQRREARSNSYGNLSVINRGPIPIPPFIDTSGQGLYSENPQMITPPPKYERTSDSRSITNRGIYEEVTGDQLFPASGQRVADNIVTPHVYLVLEKQDEEIENGTDRSYSCPEHSRPTPPTLSCPDVVTDATNSDNRVSKNESTKVVLADVSETTDINEESRL